MNCSSLVERQFVTTTHLSRAVIVHYEHIKTQHDLNAYCDRIAGARTIAFDTEFVSEDSYQPDLCLIQVAADDALAIIDTKAVDDVTPFWELLVSNGHETIVHAGREEFLFCRRTVGQRPHGMEDIQIAAGLVGLEYPASLQTLLGKLLGKSVPKGETRTDWRRRPLSHRQLEYAIHDVDNLLALRDELFRRLDKLDRRSWLEDEMQAWQSRLEQAEEQKRWQRVAGIAGLNSRQLAVVRELWSWREDHAAQQNKPPKRVLRDDLVVELARRRTADPKRIRAVRGLNHRGLQPLIPELTKCIERGLELPDEECPRPTRRPSQPQLHVVGQFLATAVASHCRSLQLSPALTASVQDVRDLVTYRLGLRPEEQGEPVLACGWRAGIVGQLVDDLLSGRLGIRIRDPLSDAPMSFDPLPASDERPGE